MTLLTICQTLDSNFNHDAVQAWDDYVATGLHVKGDDVLSWIASWGTPDELPAPTPKT